MILGLMRLLLDLGPTRLEEIAPFWEVEDEGPRLAARLFHAMTDQKTVRTMLSELNPELRLLLGKIVPAPESSLSGDDLLRILPYSEDEMSQLLYRLRLTGLIVLAELDGRAIIRQARPARTEVTPGLLAGRATWSERSRATVPAELARTLKKAWRR